MSLAVEKVNIVSAGVFLDWAIFQDTCPGKWAGIVSVHSNFEQMKNHAETGRMKGLFVELSGCGQDVHESIAGRDV